MLPASLRKLKETTQEEKPKDKLDQKFTADIDPTATGLGSVTWKFCSVCSRS